MKSLRWPPVFPPPSRLFYRTVLVPVFIDNDPVTLNGRVEQLAAAFVPGKTRAVMMAHTLGNPFDLATVTRSSWRAATISLWPD